MTDLLWAWLLSIGQWLTSTWQWLQPFGPVVGGLFGGIGAILVWEGVLKPARERRLLARLLMSENAHNLELIAKASLQAELSEGAHTSVVVPPDFALATLAFDSSVHVLGLLPHRTLRRMIAVASHCRSLNRMPALYESACSELRACQISGSSSQRQRARAVVDEHVAAYRHALDTAHYELLMAQELLRHLTVPKWRFSPLQERLDPEKLKRSLQQTEAARGAYRRHV